MTFYNTICFLPAALNISCKLFVFSFRSASHCYFNCYSIIKFIYIISINSSIISSSCYQCLIQDLKNISMKISHRTLLIIIYFSNFISLKHIRITYKLVLAENHSTTTKLLLELAFRTHDMISWHFSVLDFLLWVCLIQ